jgi:hypothetical protein
MTWKPATKARYWDMLEVLPPAVMGGGAFMVGEPMKWTNVFLRQIGLKLSDLKSSRIIYGAKTIAELQERARQREISQ